MRVMRSTWGSLVARAFMAGCAAVTRICGAGKLFGIMEVVSVLAKFGLAEGQMNV